MTAKIQLVIFYFIYEIEIDNVRTIESKKNVILHYG